MGKLTNCLLAAMIASPFVIKYLRYRRLSAFVRLKPQLDDTDSENEADGILADASKDYFIRIPAFAVGAVVGKRGMTLRRLMYETQTECVLRSYTPEELDVASNEVSADAEWTEQFQNEDWFGEESTDTRRKITYLLVRATDEQCVKLVRLRIAEIIDNVQKPWKTAEFEVETQMVGYLVGRGGRHIKTLRDKFSVNIQISDPIPDDPTRSLVTVRGRDLTALKEVEVVMKETVLPRNYNCARNRNYDEDTFLDNGIYDDVDEEIKDLKKVTELLAQDFF